MTKRFRIPIQEVQPVAGPSLLVADLIPVSRFQTFPEVSACGHPSSNNKMTHERLTTHIKDAGIVIRRSQGYIMSILQGPERGWRGWISRYELTKSTKIVISDLTTTEIEVCVNQISGKLTNSRRRPTEQASPVSFNPCLTHSHLMTAPKPQKSDTYIRKIWF